MALKWRELPERQMPSEFFGRTYAIQTVGDFNYVEDHIVDPLTNQVLAGVDIDITLSEYDLLWRRDRQCGYFWDKQFVVSMTLPDDVYHVQFFPGNLMVTHTDAGITIYQFDDTKTFNLLHTLALPKIMDHRLLYVGITEKRVLSIVNRSNLYQYNLNTGQVIQYNRSILTTIGHIALLEIMPVEMKVCPFSADLRYVVINHRLNRFVFNANRIITILDLSTTPPTVIKELAIRNHYLPEDCWTMDNKLKIIRTTGFHRQEPEMILDFGYLDCNTRTLHYLDYNIGRVFLSNLRSSTSLARYAADNIYFECYAQRLIYVNVGLSLVNILQIPTLAHQLDSAQLRESIKLLSGDKIVLYVKKDGVNMDDVSTAYTFDKFHYQLMNLYQDADSQLEAEKIRTFLLSSYYGQLATLPEELIQQILDQI